jgi:hypothetical protein
MKDTYLAGSVSLNALVDYRITTHYPTKDILMIDVMKAKIRIYLRSFTLSGNCDYSSQFLTLS